MRAPAPGRRHIGADPVERRPEAILLEWLEQVVERPDAERFERIALVGRHEDHGGQWIVAEGRGYVEAADLGHLDVEEQHVGTHPGDGVDRLVPFDALAHDLHIGLAAKQAPKPRPPQRLVVHDEGADRRRGHEATGAARRRGIARAQVVPPRGADESSNCCAAP